SPREIDRNRGPMARLPRLMGRGRALEVPDADLDAFVDALATRIASFDKRAISETKRFADVASLPPKEGEVRIPMSHHASGPNFGFPRGDARLDMTDLYVLTKRGDPTKSIIVLNVHPSFALNPPGPTTKEPFAPRALYELKIDPDGDAVADLAYSLQVLSSGDGKQTATIRRLQGERAAGVGDEGEILVEGAPVSVG